jgi:Arc/MetJ family transcription regulator
MRTNIVIDDQLLAEVMRLTGIGTKRQAVDRALRTLLRIEQQRSVLDLEGNVKWEGDLSDMRTARRAAEPGVRYRGDTG